MSKIRVWRSAEKLQVTFDHKELRNTQGECMPCITLNHWQWSTNNYYYSCKKTHSARVWEIMDLEKKRNKAVSIEPCSFTKKHSSLCAGHTVSQTVVPLQHVKVKGQRCRYVIFFWITIITRPGPKTKQNSSKYCSLQLLETMLMRPVRLNQSSSVVGRRAEGKELADLWGLQLQDFTFRDSSLI